ncbi:beta strand repeat-containing protein [Planctomycetaceae bacterium SH139]
MFFDRFFGRQPAQSNVRSPQSKRARQRPVNGGRPGPRRLRLERLLARELLAGDFAAISGNVFTDLQDNGLDAGDPAVAGVTVSLYRDGGDNVFNFGQVGSDDALTAADITDADGNYEFTGLNAGTYFVQQTAAVGRLQRAADALVQVVIDEALASGDSSTGQVVIDTFDGARQQVADPNVVGPPAINTTDSAAAPEALGGERDLRAVRTSGTGSVAIDINGVETDLVVITASPSGEGTANFQWDGADGDATNLDPVGLRAGGAAGVDLTVAGAEGILVQARSDQAGDQVVITVHTDATNFSTVTLNIPDLSALPGLTTEAFTIPFDDFSTGGGAAGPADFTNVGAISAEVSLSNNSQVLFNVVGAVTPSVTTINFPSFLPLTVGNLVFNDLNNNGVRDVGEPGIDGVDVNLFLDDNDGVFEPGVDQQIGGTATTAGGGLYSFDGLFPGTYFAQIPNAEFTLGATLSGFQSSQLGTPAPDPNNDVDNDDNGNAVATQGVVAGPLTLVSLSEPDGAGNTNNRLDIGVAPQVDVEIQKSVFTTTPRVGAPATYRLIVSNNGPQAATDVVVVDTLPAGIDPTAGGLVSVTRDGVDITGPGVGTVTVAGQTLTMPTIATLAVGTDVIFDITVNVPADGVGAFNNQATVASGGADTDPNNNASDVNLNPARELDLQLTKVASDTDINVGDSFTYTLTILNVGPSTGTGVTVTDVLPAGLTFNSGTITRGGVTSGVGVTEAGGTVTAAIGDIGVNEPITVDINVTAGPAAIGVINNSASVTTPNETDTVPANNQAVSAPVTVTAIVDLVLTKQAPANGIAGEELVYTFEVSNVGPADATAVTIVDTLPAGVTFVNGSNNATFDATTPGQVTIDVGGVAAGAAAPTVITMTVLVPATAAPGLINNTAVVSTAVQTELPATLANNNAVAPTTIAQEVDLAVTKADNIDPVVPGNELVYTIEVLNNGPSAASSVTLTDQLPTGTSLVSIFENGINITNSATINGNQVSLALGTVLPDPNPQVYTFTVAVASNVTTQLSNTVTVSSAQQTFETNTQNNSAVETTQVTPTAVISVTKDDNVTSATPGEQLTYTINVSNVGPSDATNLVVTDTLPAGVSVVSSSVPGPVAGQTGSITLQLGSLPANQNTQVLLVVNIQPSTQGTLTNTVTVTGGGVTAGVLTAQHQTPLSPEFDVDLQKTASATEVAPGDTVVLEITATNFGPSTATNVNLSELLPAGLNFQSGTLDGTPINSPAGANPVIVALGDLEPNAARTILINAVVDPNLGVGTQLNPAADVPVALDETNPNNNQAAVQLTVVNDNGSIIGRVILDNDLSDTLNNTGTAVADTPLAGVVIQLLDANGVATGATSTTNANGEYSFTGLVPGTYQIRRGLPAGLYDGVDELGNGAAAQSIIDAATMQVTLGAGNTTAENFDFGLRPFSKLLFFV